MEETLQNKTANATKWSSITEVSSRIVMPFVNIILARLLTPDAFGVVATITMIVSFAEIFADAGFQKFIIQHDFKDKDDLDKSTNVAFFTNLLISLLAWGIIVFFNDELATLVGNPGLGLVVIVASLSLPLQAFCSIQMSRFKRDMDFKSLFYIRMISVIVPLVVTIPVAYFTHSYWALIIGTLASSVVNAVTLTIRSKWKPKLYYSIDKFKEMFSYSWWILMESISTWMTSYSDTLIISLSLSSYYIGLYKTSMVTVNQIMGLIVAAVSGPLFVALSRLKNDKEKLVETYNSQMQSIAFFIFPLSAGIWLYKDFITMILLGKQWGEASNFIGLWGGLSSISLVFGTFANGLYNAVGKTFLSFSVSIANLLIMIPLLLWATPKGFECLYTSRSALRIAFVVIQLSIMFIALRYPILLLIRKTIAPAVATLCMCVVSSIVRIQSQSMLSDCVGILICAITYIVICWFAFRKSFVYALDTLGINPVRRINKNEG